MDERFHKEDPFGVKKDSQSHASSIPTGYREEHKRVVCMPHPTIPGKTIRYRLCYTKNGDIAEADVLRIEVSYGLESLASWIRKILEFHKFKRLLVYVKYGELLKLNDEVERIGKDLFTYNYKFKFGFIPDSYEESEYVLLYDIEGIKKGEHYG
ncbi:hypothetical protein CWI42_060560 [Ordospora colligata]|uniref:Uncharacterized protein n=1 Tax=Ordospora colligata OC4 TaxID=1354746 RepID=A0A0B2UKI7_9MICR|nr:uncharacterized protein M896_060560 [Ordospora colligata OC4]KHN69557.1 hypothetical protein M896_060560 [Ordospora colligata OC4]TBU15377.1 hypothetical protein CWI41_060550 [Ordospora colligata]TBU15477.1 hypothetical protein CWI40_060550 [Ordospora colligata]TBU18573.1 hypothetical protein CWI42_060560 [Ordospora colligata]